MLQGIAGTIWHPYGKTACQGYSVRLDQLDRDVTQLLLSELCRVEWPNWSAAGRR